MPTSIPVTTLEKFNTFGDLLRFLRRRAGITQIELATAVGYSDTQISRLEQNLRLPDIPTIEARFISALDLDDEPNAIARLLDLAANVRREDAPGLGLCPYKGLNYFDEPDADLFVGREVLTTRLIERVFSLTSSGSRFLAVVGASGSGKSSLVRAGLVSALRWNQSSTDWHIHVLTPTAHPLESLAASLTQGTNSVVATATLMDDLAQEARSLQIFAKRKLRSSNGSRLLLVIDQFEELFALCRSEEERVSFIENLLAAASEADGPVILLITLRADFYAHCANYAKLREALAKNQEYIGTMSDEELRRAIEEPARRGRWEFEPGLVDLLLHDVGHEPGALPLLSHALLETWQRRRGRTMTLSGYAASGGVRGAIAETAETVFSDQFTQEQRAIARRIFLRLTELGDESGAGDTRRRATFNELILKPEEATTTRAVLKALADARLITTSENAAEVAHEALIREWPTLHGWLDENREGLRLHRQLTEAAQEWLGMERESDVLFRGARLAQTREWAAVHQEEMNALEDEFLLASIEASEHEAAEREAQRQRELDAARKLAESERQRAEAERRQVEQQIHTSKQLRKRAIYLSAVLTLAIIAALAAGLFGYRANVSLTRSEAERIAAEANNLVLTNGDTNLIALLTIRSLNMHYTPAGDTALAAVTTLGLPPRELRGHESDVWGADFSPNGKILATGSYDNTIRLWDFDTGETMRILPGGTNSVEEIAFSPDGKTIVAAGWSGSAVNDVALFSVASGEAVRVFSGHTAGMNDVAFFPDGKSIISGSEDSTARIWDVATGQTLHVLTGPGAAVIRLEVSPDGKYVVTGSMDGTARLWDASTGEQMRIFNIPIGAVAFSPDSKYFATGSDDLVARIWEVSTGQVVHEFFGADTLGVAFSPDGRLLLTGGGDRTASLWDIATGERIRFFTGHGAAVQTVLFSPDGRQIVTTSNDGIVRVWNLEPSSIGMQFIGHNINLKQASFSPDGKLIVTAGIDGIAHLWNRETGQITVTLTGHTNEALGAVFSPDGKIVLTASADGTARLWDAVTGEKLLRLEGHTDAVSRAAFSPDASYIVTTSWDGTARVWDPKTGETKVVYSDQGPEPLNWVAVSPDGKMAATSGDDGTTRIWDPLTGKELTVFKGHSGRVMGVAFSPDGKYLLTCSVDGTARLWDVSSGKEIRRFAGHPGGAFAAAFSPDGKFVLTSGRDGTARLWDVKTGNEIRRFVGHTNAVSDVTFSPDGTYILTASEDSTARLWLADLQDTIIEVCATLTRDLTPEEQIQFGISEEGPTCPVQ
ncbi:MAG TPA: helix-turn-helix domain-containing protein [Anaerolineales bacterium]|nr:helix-turn-helix domain-containing protein [Anaerolineales bacterium]